MSHFSAATSALVLIDHQVGTLQLVKNLDAAEAALKLMAGFLQQPTTPRSRA